MHARRHADARPRRDLFALPRVPEAATMTAMSRLRSLSSALLSLGLLLGGHSVAPVPVAARHPRTRCRADAGPESAGGRGAAGLGQLRPIRHGHKRYPHRAVHHRVRPDRLQQSRWRAGQAGGDPRARHRPTDGIAAGQSRAVPAARRSTWSPAMAPDLESSPTSDATSTWSASTPEAWATPPLRCGCRTDAEFDAYRREPMVDYSPAGVAHIEQLYQQLAQQCVNRMGTGVSGQHRHRVRRARHGRGAPGAGRRPDQLPRLQLRHRVGHRLPGEVRQPRAGDGARRRHRPDRRPDRRERQPNGGIPNRFQRLRHRLRPLGGLPAGHRPGPVRRPLPRPGRPAGRTGRAARPTHAG